MTTKETTTTESNANEIVDPLAKVFDTTLQKGGKHSTINQGKGPSGGSAPDEAQEKKDRLEQKPIKKSKAQGQAEQKKQEQKKKQMKEKRKDLSKTCLTYSPDALGAVIASIENNQPLLLIGQTGTGKTTIIREAASIYEKELYRVNLTGQTGREDLVGKYVLIDGATEWQDGLLTLAMRHGHWLLLDEINAALPEVLLAIQAISERRDGALGSLVLTERDGEHVVPHPEFRLFATCNPPSYLGLKDFNTATLSRFICAHIDVMSEKQAAAYFGTLYPVMEMHTKAIYRVLARASELYIKGEVAYCASMRDMDHIGALMEGGLSIDESLLYGFINKYIVDDERKVIVQLVESSITTYAKYLKTMKDAAAIEVKKESEVMEHINTIKGEPLMDKEKFDAIVRFFNTWIDARNKREQAERELNAIK